MSYKIAITSTDGMLVNQRFGHCERFLLCEVDEETGQWKQIEEVEIPMSEGEGNHHEQRFKGIALKLEGVRFLLTERIGPKPHRILLQKGITALETSGQLSEAIRKLNEYVSRH